MAEPMAVPAVHPLLAQPLIELCLNIPSWLWARDGRNRAVARQSFAGLLPRQLIERTSKGRLESLFAKAFARSRPALRELLLEGELRRQALVDPALIEAYLKADREPPDDGYIRLFEMAALEQWLQSLRR